MKILFVVNSAFTDANGLAASCRRTVHYLREAGEEVRLLSSRGNGKELPEYLLPDAKVPVFDKLIHTQGYNFAKADETVVREAVRWADVVHLEEPFGMQRRVCRIVEEEKKPLTATCHLHPENLFSSIHLRKDPLLNHSCMLLWRNQAFNRCSIIQCPTEDVKERLEHWHFKPELRVISNGLPPAPPLLEVPAPKEDGSFTVVCTGRYSVEKDQLTLLRAMRYSRYADRIRLVLAGRGPQKKRLEKEAAKLVRQGVLQYPPVFSLYTPEGLRTLYAGADLYVHCALVEVEGLSCMEAIRTGLVPVIADAKLSAAAEFARSKESIFRGGDPKQLAERIDYWLSDDGRRSREAARYNDFGSEYDIRISVEKLRRMFRDAIEKAR
ncbi:MAG: glycosyltransferase [Lachnospiraceae bacterium]|nr:glycosyltransferase [Oscillospiraceae bacterium]MBQ6678771.1 glycosyltransferase [Lachnospiraceae bacterium]